MKMRKVIIASVICLFSVMLFAFSAYAEEGYVKGKGGVETNIKWSVTKEGDDIVARFEIDPNATDKTQTTVIEGYDPETGTAASYKTPIKNGWGQNAKITKAVIGDGITKLGTSLFNQNRTLKVVELPKTVTTFDWSVFEHCNALKTVYIAGNEPENGTLDLSCIEKFSGYEFHATTAVKLIKKVIFNPNMTEYISAYLFHNQTGITEIEIPAGVSEIKKNAFKATDYIQTFKVLGKDTTFESADVFSDCTGFPKIVGLVGSKAEEFAKENGYTFVSLETNETVFEGTKAPAKVRTETPDTGTDTPKPDVPVSDDPTLEKFDPTGATAYGHMTGEYLGTPNVDTYWAYYEDTKTLKFTSGTTSYNETGNVGNCDKGTASWADYKKDVEHIEIGANFNYISFKAFIGCPKLIDIKIPASISQIGALAFQGNSSLTTIWVTGTERVEGTADLSNIGKELRDSFQGTKIVNFILGEKYTKISFVLPTSVRKIITPQINDEILAYGEKNFIDIVDKNDQSKVYKYFQELDPSYTMCGERCAYDFDSATGILTVYGVGPMMDIMNYHGGGSKTAPWFDIKQEIKHIVISDNITSIGKYDFAYCKNLQTVELPDKEFELGNAAFEGCEGLVSIYRRGTDAIEGTLDLSKINKIEAWTFAKNYLVANVIFGENVEEIATSAFDEAVNVKNIYGVPASAAETFANGGYTFLDSATNTPVPVKCEPPATETETEAPAPDTETSAVSTEKDTVSATETETTPIFVDESDVNTSTDAEDGGNSTVIIVIAVVCVVVVLIAVLAVILLKKKKNKA